MPATTIRKAVFPVAGLGTRFLPATKASPKEMLPLVDKPLIQYVVEEAIASGVSEMIMITGRGKRAIEDHFDISYELEDNLRQKGKTRLLQNVRRISNMVDFCYVRQKELRGLGHAITCVRDLVGDEPFAVLLGDDIIDARVPVLKQMIRVYARYKASVVAVQKVPRSQIHQYGVIRAEQVDNGVYRVLDLVEKPEPKEAPSNLAIIGRYILTPQVFDALGRTRPGRAKEIQLTDGLRNLLRTQALYAYLFEGTRYDAGDKLGFLQATVEYALKDPGLGPPFRKYLRRLIRA